jgi:type III pantothenate kinase
MVWLALVVGNSRFHWGLFEANRLVQRWDTPHGSASQLRQLQEQGFSEEVLNSLGIQPPPDWLEIALTHPELWVASVVESALEGLAPYPKLTVVEQQHIPLGGLYETMGIDRVLTLLGAGAIYGWPVLVVDWGTALTLTAGAQEAAIAGGAFIGGAILPGLGLQFRALHDYTDQLPWIDHRGLAWPDRWATTTEGAMASGILHNHLAGIQDFLADWWQRYPNGQVIFTGGDGVAMAAYIRQHRPSLAGAIQTDPDLMFWGLRDYRRLQLKDR